MGALSWLLGGDDAKLAAEEYSGQKSASERARQREEAATARRVARHHRGGATSAARQGQAWEDADRWQEQHGRSLGRRRR
ncbi:hypothetical protein RM572_00650 [Streptomyces sp. DSM 42041]|uniref:Uncharacterized protein n=1 Tax=Streptomyces hazeniae TaxID=3075538 RepID=A0ABU2NJX2_9ACTN|nr:hypothetical protein [Streptomyces sp. DSM 42041]MDT0377285.1 hypothetical protein [Streptomyces sp. DSM 42041]